MERISGKWWAVAMVLISAWGRGAYTRRTQWVPDPPVALRDRGVRREWHPKGSCHGARTEYWRGVFPGKQQRVLQVAVGGARALSYGYRRRP